MDDCVSKPREENHFVQPKSINHLCFDSLDVRRDKRPAISRWVWIIVIIVVIAVIGVGEAELNIGGVSKGTTQIDLRIIEDNLVLEEDDFYPDSLYVPLNQNISMAVQNTDDEQRTFALPQFNINLTISPGETQRVNFEANKLGTFNYTSPITPASIASAEAGPMPQGILHGDAELDPADDQHRHGIGYIADASSGSGSSSRADRQLQRSHSIDGSLTSSAG